jgi:hypothetical protein
MIIKIDKNGEFPVSKLKNMLDINRICFYTVQATRKGTIRIKFYDSNMKLIPLKTKEEIHGKKAKKSKR